MPERDSTALPLLFWPPKMYLQSLNAAYFLSYHADGSTACALLFSSSENKEYDKGMVV